MSVFAGDCAVLKIPEVNIKIALEVEKIENDIAYFGKCISGMIKKSDIMLVEGDMIEEGSVIEAFVHWKCKNEILPVNLVVGSIDTDYIYLKSCKSSVPLKFLTDSEDVKIYGRDQEESSNLSAEGCSKCSCETPCRARCICKKDYF